MICLLCAKHRSWGESGLHFKEIFYFTAFVSSGCCNKLSHTRWLKTAGICSQQFRRSERSEGWLLLGALSENWFHTSLLDSGGCMQPLEFLGLYTHNFNLCLYLHTFCSVFSHDIPLCIFQISLSWLLYGHQ